MTLLESKRDKRVSIFVVFNSLLSSESKVEWRLLKYVLDCVELTLDLFTANAGSGVVSEDVALKVLKKLEETGVIEQIERRSEALYNGDTTLGPGDS